MLASAGFAVMVLGLYGINQVGDWRMSRMRPFSGRCFLYAIGHLMDS